MHRGPGRYLLYYSLRGGELMNLIGCGHTDTWEEEGWSIPATAQQFLDAYADFAPHLLDLIRAVPDDALFKWGLYDRAPLEVWASGRVAILGDAAHPMTPFLGQGASMAVEDAVVLARSLEASSTVGEALGIYAGDAGVEGVRFVVGHLGGCHLIGQLGTDCGHLLWSRHVLDDEATSAIELGVHGIGVLARRAGRNSWRHRGAPLVLGLVLHSFSRVGQSSLEPRLG